MFLDIRTKRTVQESITRHIESSGTVHEVEYCPGNGTRYHLVFVTSSQLVKVIEGDCVSEFRGWLVTLTNSMRSMFVQKTEQLLHFGYVEEKLGCGLADAVCLAEIIGHITGRPYVSCEEVRTMPENVGVSDCLHVDTSTGETP